jgi:hypothetical protein
MIETYKNMESIRTIQIFNNIQNIDNIEVYRINIKLYSNILNTYGTIYDRIEKYREGLKHIKHIENMTNKYVEQYSSK